MRNAVDFPGPFPGHRRSPTGVFDYMRGNNRIGHTRFVGDGFEIPVLAWGCHNRPPVIDLGAAGRTAPTVRGVGRKVILRNSVKDSYSGGRAAQGHINIVRVMSTVVELHLRALGPCAHAEGLSKPLRSKRTEMAAIEQNAIKTRGPTKANRETELFFVGEFFLVEGYDLHRDPPP